MKILIIEDDNGIIENLTLTFKVGWSDACLLSTRLGEEGVDLVESESPDLVVLDLGLPDISGFEVLKRIRLFSKVPILILTVTEDESAIVKAFDLGVNEYVFKPFRQMEILARLKALARNSNTITLNTFFKYGPFQFNPYTHMVKYKERTILLTRSEFLLLQHLAINQGKIMAYSSIAETLWGNDYPGSEKAIRVYIRQIRKKMESDPEKPGIILTESKVGYYIK